jgi:predicted DNA-binding transcriptional regulator AlpA
MTRLESHPTPRTSRDTSSTPSGTTRSAVREKLLTPEQVAAWLQVRVELLYKWRYSRCGPPSLKIGRYVRYREVDVAAWIEEQSRASA